MGAPAGNQNARKTKLWTESIKRALARYDSSTVEAGLDKLADKVVRKAIEEGDKDSWQEIGNRLDGKPAQAIIGGDEDDAPIVHRIERVIKRANPVT